jgi:dynein heavy chain, axonemal
MNNYLPPVWKKVSYSSLKPLNSWYVDLLERVKMMKKWLETGNPPAYWLSGFFFPQGTLQTFISTNDITTIILALL